MKKKIGLLLIALTMFAGCYEFEDVLTETSSLQKDSIYFKETGYVLNSKRDNIRLALLRDVRNDEMIATRVRSNSGERLFYRFATTDMKEFDNRQIYLEKKKSFAEQLGFVIGTDKEAKDYSTTIHNVNNVTIIPDGFGGYKIQEDEAKKQKQKKEEEERKAKEEAIKIVEKQIAETKNNLAELIKHRESM